MVKVEDQILKLSLYGTVVSVIVGLAFGWLIKSQILIFDAIYSLVGLGLSVISFIVYKIIDNDTKKYAFNKYLLEPMVILFNSVVLIYMCTSSIRSGILDIISGGNEVEVGLAIIYSIINLIFTAIVYYKIKKSGKNVNSQLIKSEGVQWLMGLITVVLVLIGFTLTLILLKTEYREYTRYIDSSMVIIASVVFLKAPIDMLLGSVKEILGLKIPLELNELVTLRAEEIKDVYEFENSITRVYKVGRSLKVSINFLVKERVSKEDRYKIDNIISGLLENRKLYKDIQIKYTI